MVTQGMVALSLEALAYVGGGGLGICDGTDCIAKPIGPDCGGLIMATRCPSKSMKHSSLTVSCIVLSSSHLILSLYM